MFDTIKGGDYLVDQDAAEVLAREAIETVIELEHMGLPFNRTPDGKIDQRRFGGHTRNYGEGPVRRSCFAADRTGHMILQTLYQQAIKHGVTFYDEYHVVDLLSDGGDLGSGGRVGGRRRLPDRRRGAPHAAREVRPAGDRRLRADVPDHLERLVADRRRSRPGVPPRRADAGHGVLPVPPDRHRRDRHPPVGGGPRRGRHPAQRRGRAVHAALRPDDDGSRPAGHGQPGDLPGGPRRPRDRRQGLRLPRPPAPRPQVHRREAARHHRLRPRLPGHRALYRADPDPADRALRDGRHPDRPRDPGHARRRGDRGSRAVRGRRVRLRQRPRRQPAGHELARRPARLRSARGQDDGGRPPRRRVRHDFLRCRCARPGRDRRASRPSARREPGPHPQATSQT